MPNLLAGNSIRRKIGETGEALLPSFQMLTLHYGLHKTGSSSIQEALRIASDSRTPPIELWPYHRPLTPPGLAGFLRGAEKGLKPHIVSNEGLLGSPWDMYFNRQEKLEALSRYFGTFPRNLVSQIIFLRGQAKWFESLVAQAVMQGIPFTQPDQIVETAMGHNPTLSYSPIVQDVSSFAALRLVSTSRDSVKTFFELVGLSQDCRLTVNKSPTPFGIAVMLELRARGWPPFVARSMVQSLRFEDQFFSVFTPRTQALLLEAELSDERIFRECLDRTPFEVRNPGRPKKPNVFEDDKMVALSQELAEVLVDYFGTPSSSRRVSKAVRLARRGANSLLDRIRRAIPWPL